MTRTCSYPGCNRAKLDDQALCELHVGETNDESQDGLFASDEYTRWFAEWKGMPEFDQKNLEPTKSLLVHFATLEDMVAFARLVDQRITPNTQSIWYPEAEIGHFADKRYADAETT